MQEGFMSSSESKECIVCGKKTANYRTYEQANIKVVIPLCDDVYNNRYCWKGVDAKTLLRRQLIELKQVVIQTSHVKVLPQAIARQHNPNEVEAAGRINYFLAMNGGKQNEPIPSN